MEGRSGNAAVTPIAANPAYRTRRVVTGHDAAGRSIIASDADCTAVLAIGHPDCVLNDVWRCERLPADNSGDEPHLVPVSLEPPTSGNLLRLLYIPPEAQLLDGLDRDQLWSAMGPTGEAAAADYEGAPHPLMHRTSTVDYIVVLQGEVHAVMEEGETLLRPGDVLIQRGTNHAWSNRTDEVCLVAVVLNGAAPVFSGTHG